MLLAATRIAPASIGAEPTTAPAAVPTPLQRANDDAVARLYAQIASESLDRLSVAQIIDQVDGYAILMDGLARAEQIGGPRQLGDEFVQVQLQISGVRAGQLVLQAVAVKPQKSPVSPERLAQLLQDWNQRVFTSTGTNVTSPESIDIRVTTDAGVITTMSATDVAAAPKLNFDTSPAWLGEPITTSAFSEPHDTKLRTARAAEQSARDALRAKVLELAVDGMKLGDVAKVDRFVNQTIDDIVAAARVYGVDYRADGSVEVRISVDGRQVWQSLLSTR